MDHQTRPFTLLRSVSTPSLVYRPLESIQERIEDLDIIIFRINSLDRIELWNGHVEYEYGYKSPCIGENVIDYWMTHQLHDTITCYSEAKSVSEPRRLTKKVGNQHYVWYFIPTLQESSEKQGISGYIINIDFMYTTLNAAEKKYEDAQMLQNALASHQTRYQCYNIMMCLQSIQDSIPLLTKTRMADIINQDGKVLTHNGICEDMLTDANKAQHFTSILLKRQQQCEDVIACQHNTMRLDMKTFDVVHLVKLLWKEMYSEAKRKNIKFCLQIESLCNHRLPVIKQDEFRFKQICTTLIDNAINFTPEHGTIHIYLGLDQDSVRFSVTDSGVGIEEDVLLSHQQKLHLGKLSFSQPRPSSGLGLSLAIAQHVIGLMNGSLEILTGSNEVSTDGDMSSLEKSVSSFDFHIGTQILINIPCEYDAVKSFYSENPDHVQFDSRRPKLKRQSRFSVTSRATILVADDDPLIRKLWNKVLKQLGYDTHLVDDGDPAISYYEAHHTSVALIVMDIQMPHNGIEATKIIRRFEDKMDLPCRVPIVANTASGSSDSLRRECQEAGMGAFLQKPNSKKEMKRIVEEHGIFN